MIELIPIAMIVPTKEHIYAPSRLRLRKLVNVDDFRGYHQCQVLVSLNGNPQLIDAYGLGLDCWYILAKNT